MLRTLLPVLILLSLGAAPLAAQDDGLPLARYGDIVLAEEEASLDLEAEVGTLWSLVLDQLGDAGALLPERVLADTWLVVDDLWLRLESLPYKSGTWTRVRVRVDGFERAADVSAAESFLVDLARGLEGVRADERRQLESERDEATADATGLAFSSRRDIASVTDGLAAVPGYSMWVPFHALLAWALAGWVDMTTAWYVSPPWEPDPWDDQGVWFGPADPGWSEGPVFAGGGGSSSSGDSSGGGGNPPSDGGGDDEVDPRDDRPPLNPPIAFGGTLGSRLGGHGMTPDVAHRGGGPGTVKTGRSTALVGTVPSHTGASLDLPGLPVGAWAPRGAGPTSSSGPGSGSSPSGFAGGSISGSPPSSLSSPGPSDGGASSAGGGSSGGFVARGQAPAPSSAAAVVRRALSSAGAGGLRFSHSRDAIVSFPRSSLSGVSATSASRSPAPSSTPGTTSTSSASRRTLTSSRPSSRSSSVSKRTSPRPSVTNTRPPSRPTKASGSSSSRPTPKASSGRSTGSKRSSGRSSPKSSRQGAAKKGRAGAGRP